MISNIARHSLLRATRQRASDFSHVYEGLRKHEIPDLLTPEQLQIQKEALNFAMKKLAPFAAEWDEKHHFPVDVIREAAGLGYSGIYMKEGCGLDRLSASLIFEALATGCVSTSAYLSIHNMCGWMVETYGNDDQRQRYLPSLLSMEKFASYCLTEPNSGSDSRAMATSAKKQGGDYLINGSKMFISGGPAAGLYIVMAKTSEKDVSAFLVQQGAGIAIGKNERKMGWNSQPTSLVTFQDCRVPERNLIGKEGEGFKMAMSALDGGRINIASCSLGGALFCLELARQYSLGRKQFGQRIADFQAIQFKLANIFSELVTSRAVVRNAALLVDRKSKDATAYAAVAKQVATEKCFWAANEALQIHGGYGYLCEYSVERVVRDLRVHMILEGTNEIMRVILGRRLVGK